MGGAACRWPYFFLGKSKQNRVLRKTRARGGLLNNQVYPQYQESSC
jgi:hypothetical protein